MTTIENHTRGAVRARSAAGEDFWVDLMPEAAELVIRSGLGSARMLGRKMRVQHAVADELLFELHELGVLGPDVAGDREVLVGEDALPAVLARIAALVEPDDEDVAEPTSPGVSLVKPLPPVVVEQDDPGDLAGDEDQTGSELVVRPGAELVVPAAGVLVRTRQATARTVVWVVDQPVVSRGLAVGRQAPMVPVRLVGWSPRGAVRAGRLVWAWLSDAQSVALLAKHAEAGEGDTHTKVAQAHQQRLVTRGWLAAVLVALAVVLALAWWAPGAFAGVLAVLVFAAGVALVPRHNVKELGYGLVGAAGAALATWWQGPRLAGLVPQPPWWTWWALAGGAVVLCGWLGRKDDKPLLQRPAAMASTKPPTVTAPMVIAALIALGNSKMKEPEGVRVLMDPHRSGPFVQIDLELPAGVTAAWVVEARERLAGALRRPMSMVWPRVGNAHPDHLVLLISEVPMNEMEQEPWPLLAAVGPIDIFTPQPVFTDQLGKWVYLTLAYASWVVGAVPRMGKTFTVRELLLIFGMDPRVKVIGLDGKGTGDLASLAPFAHLHVRGARVDKPENIEEVRSVVGWLLREMGRRADILAGLPFEEVPDSKVTSELINAHPELDLGPIVLGIDETQSFFSYGFKANREHKEIREEIRDGVIELMRMGPALGIWVIMATQTVRDSTIPVEAQAVAVYRYALKMEGWEPNDKVLGTGAHRAGTTATIFGFEEKGIGWFKGEGSKPFIARSVVGLDAVQARTIATRTRAWRQARNLLTGQAGDDGIQDAEVVYDVVADAEHVMSTRGCGKAQWAELVSWLQELRSGQYGGLTEEELSAAVRAAEVRVRDVRSGESVRKGVYLSDLRKRGGDDREF